MYSFWLPEPELTPELLNNLHINPAYFQKRNISIQIDKSKYQLKLLYNHKPIKTYPVVFGADPVRDKYREGDRRTPEGGFHIRDLYRHRQWRYFIWIDYPTPESWIKHNQAKTRGEIPQSATIGGEVGIHGSPLDMLVDFRINWTLGCIGMKSKDITEIYPLLQRGALVEIVP